MLSKGQQVCEGEKKGEKKERKQRLEVARRYA